MVEDVQQFRHEFPNGAWINVYIEADDGILRADLGAPNDDRGDCEAIVVGPPGNRFRIHVRLKPEGAPRRYASEGERHAWDRNPRMARWHRENGLILQVEPWAWPTPKTLSEGDAP